MRLVNIRKDNIAECILQKTCFSTNAERILTKIKMECSNLARQELDFVCWEYVHKHKTQSFAQTIGVQ
jgi:hypothetical protein